MAEKFDSLSTEEALTRLETTRAGLPEDEASRRLSKYGFNEVIGKKESNIIRFLKKFWAPVPWMLEITIALTYFLGKFLDMYIIVFLLLFNSVMSYVQESRAQDAIELLNHEVSINARVLRDKAWKVIRSRLLVPGDIVHVRMGDIAPGDLKILEGEVDSDQSMLTGESLPVSKKEGDLIFSGSVIKRGEATGLVIATGASTMFGKTTELVQEAGSKSHLEILIMDIVKYLVIMDIVLIVSLISFSVVTHESLSDVIPFSLVVLIASVPVALPATFTMAMAISAQDLSRKGILVTRLTAVEDAATMDAICLDKTGTITENKLTVKNPIPVEGTERDLVRYAMLASDESTQDPIDIAIIKYGRNRNYDVSRVKTIKFTPFDPAMKRTEVVIEEDGREATIMKGAPQVLIELCNHNSAVSIMEDVRNLAMRGFRAIAVAKCTDDRKTFLGIIPLYDPPRADSKKFISQLREMGIVPKMVTGDSEPIAEEISKEVGIGERACKISSLKQDGNYLENCDSIAEVFPEDKYQIVKLLQGRNHITGMTGDGVNDAPALKQAEVGIAVSSATDVAKASASIVLTHEGLTDIVSAVEDGRRTYQRMLTYTLNKIIKTVQVAIFLTVSFFVVRFFVTTPFDIILLLFANDFVTMSIATDNVRFSKNPEKWRVRPLVGSSVALSLLIVVESFFILWTALLLKLTLPEIQTYIFDMLVFSGQFTVYMVRERKRFWHSKPSNFLLIASTIDIALITLISGFGILVTKIPFSYVLLVLLITFAFMALFDQIKGIIFNHYGI